jgi:NTP pyrophosphatase (non-canonical NTP hydrolase)
MTSRDAHLIHMILGISGEAGELLDAIKKSVIYLRPLDIPNIIEELGDLEFYMEGLRERLNITREQVLQDNINKLTIRYGKMYSDKSANERKDKQ